MSESARQAPPPAFLSSVINQAKKKPAIEPSAEKDKVMLEFAVSDAWQILKEYIQAKQMMLGKQLRDNTKGASLDEIGFRFLVMDAVNDFAQELIVKVEAVRKIKELENERESSSNPSK